jgi:hypothetical protein
MNLPKLFAAPLLALPLLLAPALPGHAGAPQDFINACQDDALRLCHAEAMSQDDVRISKCMRAHKRLVSAPCLAKAKKYRRL